MGDYGKKFVIGGVKWVYVTGEPVRIKRITKGISPIIAVIKIAGATNK